MGKGLIRIRYVKYMGDRRRLSRSPWQERHFQSHPIHFFPSVPGRVYKKGSASPELRFLALACMVTAGGGLLMTRDVFSRGPGRQTVLADRKGRAYVCTYMNTRIALRGSPMESRPWEHVGTCGSATVDKSNAVLERAGGTMRIAFSTEAIT
jgi:hypothetical protein